MSSVEKVLVPSAYEAVTVGAAEVIIAVGTVEVITARTDSRAAAVVVGAVREVGEGE